MKYSMYNHEGKYYIYKGMVVSDYDELPNEKSVHISESLDEATEWIDSNGMINDYYLFEIKETYSTDFIDDLVKLAQKRFDDYIEEGSKLGWGILTIDRSWTSHTYRDSAAWKEEKTLYTFEQSLKWSNPSAEIDDSVLRARDNYILLLGMADAIYELGKTLVFDDEFTVHIKGGNKTWVMKTIC